MNKPMHIDDFRYTFVQDVSLDALVQCTDSLKKRIADLAWSSEGMDAVEEWAAAFTESCPTAKVTVDFDDELLNGSVSIVGKT